MFINKKLFFFPRRPIPCWSSCRFRSTAVHGSPRQCPEVAELSGGAECRERACSIPEDKKCDTTTFGYGWEIRRGIWVYNVSNVKIQKIGTPEKVAVDLIFLHTRQGFPQFLPVLTNLILHNPKVPYPTRGIDKNRKTTRVTNILYRRSRSCVVKDVWSWRHCDITYDVKFQYGGCHCIGTYMWSDQISSEPTDIGPPSKSPAWQTETPDIYEFQNYQKLKHVFRLLQMLVTTGSGNQSLLVFLNR